MTVVLPQAGSGGTLLVQLALLVSHLQPIKDLVTFKSCLSPTSLSCAEPPVMETAGGRGGSSEHGSKGEGKEGPGCCEGLLCFQVAQRSGTAKAG